MAHKLIYGFSGNNLALDFAGSNLVCMESPNPHPPWSAVELYTPVRCTWSASEGEITAFSNVSGAASFEVALDVFLVYTGVGTINCSVTKSSDCTSANSNGGCRVNGSGYFGTFNVTTPGTNSGTMPVPYYRYRLRFALGGGGQNITTSSWAKLSVSFS